MSERTLDQVLADAGLTREEWQRARPVIENDWRLFAEMNGWGPPTQNSAAPVVVNVPIRPGRWLRLEMPSDAFTEDDFEYLINLLETMKPGLIRAPRESS